MFGTIGTDCWQLVLARTDDPWVFKRTYLTCRHFMDIYENYLPHLVRKYTNHLWILLEMFPSSANVNWDYYQLSSNPNLPWEYVAEHIDKPWHKYRLSQNLNIPINFLIESGIFSASGLAWREDFTWDIIISNPDIPWDYDIISFNPNITWDIIQANPHPPGGEWDEFSLMSNPNITWEIMINNFDMQNIEDMEFIGENPNITWDIIIANPNPPFGEWDYWELSYNPNITWDIVQAYPINDWAMDALSGHENITMEIIKNNPNIKWDYAGVVRNPNVSWDDITNNPELFSNILSFYLSGNPNITDNDIINNPEPFPGKKWDWRIISKNRNISWSTFYKYCNRPKVLSCRVPSWELVICLADEIEWDWEYISTNRFKK